MTTRKTYNRVTAVCTVLGLSNTQRRWSPMAGGRYLANASRSRIADETGLLWGGWVVHVGINAPN